MCLNKSVFVLHVQRFFFLSSEISGKRTKKKKTHKYLVDREEFLLREISKMQENLNTLMYTISMILKFF